MHKKDITVLVTGVSGCGVGEGIVKALRLAGRYRIVTTDIDALSATLYRSDAGYLVPRAEEPGYIERLLDVCRCEDVRVVIPGSEPELERISKDRHFLLQENVWPIIGPPNTIKVGQDKWLTYEFLRQNSFSVPFTALLEDVIGSEFPYPAVIKPRIGGGGSRNVFTVKTDSELQDVRRMFNYWGQVGIVQQYVGQCDLEYTIGVLISRDGRILSTVCLKRTLMGGASGRMMIANRPAICNIAERICLALKVRGPANLQCRLDTQQKIWILELNVRFSGTTPVRAALGVNEPDLAIRDQVLKEDLEPMQVNKDIAIMRGFQEVYVPMASLSELKTKGQISCVGILENYF